MKKTLIIFIAVLFVVSIVKGQKLYIFGERSYSCTDEIKLDANGDIMGLDVVFAKDEKAVFVAVNQPVVSNQHFCGKLIIFLKDGNVITCNVSEASEKVDDIAKTLYRLTNDQLGKLKVSNIHTVKYSICGGFTGKIKTDYSASNKEIETSMLISELFKE